MTTKQIPTTYPEASEFVVKYFTERSKGFNKLTVQSDIFFKDHETVCEPINDMVFTTWFTSMEFIHGLKHITVEKGVDCHYVNYNCDDSEKARGLTVVVNTPTIIAE